MALALTIVAICFLLVSLWCFFWPLTVEEYKAVKVPKQTVIEIEEISESQKAHNVFRKEPSYELSKFAVGLYLPKTADSCEGCNSNKIVWTQDPARPGAKLGICRRCAKIRFDESNGQIISV